jgi:Tocopherol cyclase
MNDEKRRNLVVYRPDHGGGYVESFFFKINNPKKGYGIWIKFTILAFPEPDRPAMASVWATHISCTDDSPNAGMRNSLELRRCRFVEHEAGMNVGRSSFGAGFTKGHLKDSFGNSIKWDINFDTAAQPSFLYPYDLMYTSRLPRFKLSTPYDLSRAEGRFTVNSKPINFKNLPLMQGHNWGPSHSSDYMWAHCNAFDNAPKSVFEGFSARMDIGRHQTPYLSMGIVKHEGNTYRFNGPKTIFSKEIATNRNSWSFTFENKTHRLKGVFIADRKHFAGLMYPNPDLTHRVCVNSNVAGAALELSRIADGEIVARLFSVRGAMLELISPECRPDVCIYAPSFDPKFEIEA